MNKDTTNIVNKIINSCYPIVELKNNLKKTIKKIDGFNLIKDKRLEEVKDVSLPPELESNYSEIDYKRIMTYKFSKEISKFARIMSDNFSNDNLIMLYNNINDLQIEKIYFNDQKELLKNFIFKKGDTIINVASYNSYFNRIRVTEKDAEIDLPHELFHMASSICLDDGYTIYGGFEQILLKSNIIIGTGLNEGYTELMVAKYYSPELLTNSQSYQYLYEVAQNLDLILGEYNMEHYYLTANLKGVVDSLAHYMSNDSIMDFIAATDYICKNVNEEKKNRKKKDKIYEQLKFVNNFLIECATRKAAKLFLNQEITIDDIVPVIKKNLKRTHSVIMRGQKFRSFPNTQQLCELIIRVLNEYDIVAFIDENYRHK